LITRHFVEGLEESEERSMREHLRACSSCRAEYDRHAELLRLVAAQTPSRAETRSLRAAVLAAIAEPARPLAAAAPARRPLLLRLAPALSAALLLVGVSVGLSGLRPAAAPDRQERGGAAGLLHADLELFAISEPSPGRFSDPRPVAEGGTLGLDEYVQLRYLHAGPGRRYLYLFGLDDRLTPLDYFPRPDRDTSIPVEETSRMTAVGPSLRLAKRHVTGTLRVVGLFSSRPLERREVHEQIARARIRGLGWAFLDKIDLEPGTTVVVKRFQVVERGER
jgi:hypothetical protein